jgi:hypothetical protein
MYTWQAAHIVGAMLTSDASMYRWLGRTGETKSLLNAVLDQVMANQKHFEASRVA